MHCKNGKTAEGGEIALGRRHGTGRTARRRLTVARKRETTMPLDSGAAVTSFTHSGHATVRIKVERLLQCVHAWADEFEFPDLRFSRLKRISPSFHSAALL